MQNQLQINMLLAKSQTLIKSFLILFALYFGYSMVLGVLGDFFPELVDNGYKQEFIKALFTDSPFKAFMTIVVMAPLLEEMMFRTLVQPSHLDLILFISVWPVVFLVGFVPLDVHWAVKLVFTCIFLFAVGYILIGLIPAKKTAKVRRCLKKYKLPMLVLSAMIFGFIHITNYVDGFIIDLPLFLLIFPRILAGIMLGWIKIKNRTLPWSMALHAMNNGFAFIILLFFFA